MSGMDRTEWPTRQHLAQLRQDGQVAYSRLSVRAVAVLAMGVCWWAMQGRIQALRSQFELALRGTAAQSAQALYHQLREVLALAWPLALIPVLAVLGVSLLSGLLQTGFMFRSANLYVNPGRLWSRGTDWFTRLRWRILGALLGGLAVLAVGVSFLWYYAGAIMGLVSLGRSDLERGLANLLAVGAALGVPLLAVVAVSAWLIDRFCFSWTHRMTRREVQAEMAERG